MRTVCHVACKRLVNVYSRTRSLNSSYSRTYICPTSERYAPHGIQMDVILWSCFRGAWLSECTPRWEEAIATPTVSGTRPPPTSSPVRQQSEACQEVVCNHVATDVDISAATEWCRRGRWHRQLSGGVVWPHAAPWPTYATLVQNNASFSSYTCHRHQ